MYACMYVCMYVCMYLSIYLCMYVCISRSLYTYTVPHGLRAKPWGFRGALLYILHELLLLDVLPLLKRSQA